MFYKINQHSTATFSNNALLFLLLINIILFNTGLWPYSLQMRILSAASAITGYTWIIDWHTHCPFTSWLRLFRIGSLHAHIIAHLNVMAKSVLHAKCWSSVHVTVGLWSMYLSAYTTIACLKVSNWKSVHVVDPATGNNFHSDW